MENCLSNYCRLCAEIKSDCDLIDANNDDLGLKCKIYDILSIEITEDIDLPKNICNECFNKILICLEFKEQSQKAQNKLREIFLLNNKVKIELSVIEEHLDEENSFNEANDDSSVDENPNSIYDHDTKEDIQVVKKEIGYSETNNERCKSRESRGDDIRKKRWNREVWKNYTWRCNDCDEEISSSKHLRQHCSEVHNKLALYVCSICSKEYQHKQFGAFYKHIYKHFNDFQYRCDICGKLSHRPDIHDQHVRTHSESEVKHICAQCGKVFKTAQYLRRHSLLHLPKENRALFTCSTCNKTFQTISALKYHNTIHTGTRVLIYCEQCGKSFTTKSNLALHIKTQHSEERPYHCEQCPKRAKFPYVENVLGVDGVKLHWRPVIFENENFNKYNDTEPPDNVILTQFKSIPNLHTHLKVHLGLKKHECNICGKLFATKPSLKRHSSTHSGVLPFQCSFCDKRFRIAQFLKIHVRQHTGERPFSCQQCNHHFANSSNYIKHMKARHGVFSVAKDPVNCNARYLKSISTDDT